MEHIPVLLSEVLRSLDVKSSNIYIDATFGRGGYTKAILGQGGFVHGVDRDASALPYAEEVSREFCSPALYWGLEQTRVQSVQREDRAGCESDDSSDGGPGIKLGNRSLFDEGNQFMFHALDFARLEQIAPPNSIDGICFDLGVSSPQLDVPERGFSFRFEGPLDMRMDTLRGITATEVINTFEQRALAGIIKTLGEEQFAQLIAKHIVENRPFETTTQLAALIKEIIPKRVSTKSKIHPATKTFQALRMYVNDELGQLEQGLISAQKLLKVGGKLAVVSFHSLEDRVVKRFFAPPVNSSRHLPAAIEKPVWKLDGRKPVIATEEEIKKNPRARSAKLRSAEKLV